MPGDLGQDKETAMRKIHISEIEWDTEDANEGVSSLEISTLPTETTIEVEDDFDVEDDVADLLSDLYGFCVVSFEWTEVE